MLKHLAGGSRGREEASGSVRGRELVQGQRRHPHGGDERQGRYQRRHGVHTRRSALAKLRGVP